MAPLSKLLFAPIVSNLAHGLLASDPRLKSSVSGRAPHRERAATPPRSANTKVRKRKRARAAGGYLVKGDDAEETRTYVVDDEPPARPRASPRAVPIHGRTRFLRLQARSLWRAADGNPLRVHRVLGERMGPVEAVEWYRPQFRAGVVAAAYLAYPVVVDVLSRLPPPNSVEGQYYFSLISIVYATLTAATITDASTRLSALRAAAVDESSMLLPLVKRLEAARLDGAVFKYAAGRLWDHASLFISSSRAYELEAIGACDDALVEVLELLLAYDQANDDVDLREAMASAEKLIEARGRRLSLENSSVPQTQYDVLKALSAALVLAYAYLTLDAAPETTAFGFEGGAFDASIGVRVLFSCVAGALVVFNSLSEDLNRPFDGSSKLSSETVSSSIRQLRATIEPHL